MDKEYKEGFYSLKSPVEDEPCIVHGYYCTDMNGQFVLGFNTHDGGGLLPIADLAKGSMLTPVTFVTGCDDGVSNIAILKR